MLGAYQNGNQNNQINGEKDNSSPLKKKKKSGDRGVTIKGKNNR